MADIIDHSLSEIRRDLKERLITALSTCPIAREACYPRLLTMLTYYLVYEEGEISYPHFLSQLSLAENQWRCFIIFGSSLSPQELSAIIDTSHRHQQELDPILNTLGMYLP
ncbi:MULTISPECIES: hypothetical protein [Vibrio]|uniref:Uncharacterized protein n=1 Tax=Vibrio ostreae TaxID=2841925 RepID=A0A975UCK2_9VIBR|nr:MULTISPECIES: hypothetical protein [Vibrio]QXO18561.1 hypothetical protein KNV97_09945 [Vibrio ostreae]WGY47141.1 hypothetical protein J0X00_20450 [Vibrio sp. ABG19]